MSELPPWLPLLFLAGVGVVASAVNTVAGGGGMLILPALMAVGLPPGVANGTMRVAALVQTMSATTAFGRRRLIQWPWVVALLPAMVIGAGLGAYAATRLADAWLRPVFGVVFVVWAVILSLRPQGFAATQGPVRPRTWTTHLWAVLIGMYGGFFQVGVGFPVMALLLIYGHSVVATNGIKVVLILGFTCLALPIFAMAGQVAWLQGLALGAGALVGGWIGVAWQMRARTGLIRWVVIVMVALSGLQMIIKSI